MGTRSCIGTTDCNGVGGKYTLGASSSITFGQFMSTMMFCEGSKEAEYSAQLMNTSSYTLDGASLVLKNASGTMMFSKK
jgi:heat shock protein HslJ